MESKEELKKLEDFIDGLYEEGKTTQEVKEELIKKGAPKDVIDQIIRLVNKDDIVDNTDKFVINGKSLSKLKELLIKKFDSGYIYRKIYSNSYTLKNGELFIATFERFGWLVNQTLSATIICEFDKEECKITTITTGGKGGLLQLSFGSEDVFSEKISDFLKEISSKNEWNVKQIKFRKEFTLEN